MAHSGSQNNRGKLETDAPLNIVSIIDCLTVLIIYLLAAASFVSVGALDASVASVDKGTGAASLSTVLMVELKSDKTMEVTLVPAEATRQPSSAQVPAENGKWDFKVCETNIRATLEQNPLIDHLILVAEPQVAYGALVTAADRLKSILPVVLGVGE